ncbi:MAG: NFACT RNA binding domain-containing protein [Candidatus Pacearchaeota archaeon]
MSKFREYLLSTGKKVFAGKNASQNDELVSLAKPNNVLIHTLEPGSSFINLGENPTKEEIKQASLLCAQKSQYWRDNKKDVLIHLFLKSDTYKNKKDKPGLWHVKKTIKTIKVKKIDILNLENDVK